MIGTTSADQSPKLNPSEPRSLSWSEKRWKGPLLSTFPYFGRDVQKLNKTQEKTAERSKRLKSKMGGETENTLL